jgi:hypothetical protein
MLKRSKVFDYLIFVLLIFFLSIISYPSILAQEGSNQQTDVDRYYGTSDSQSSEITIDASTNINDLSDTDIIQNIDKLEQADKIDEIPPERIGPHINKLSDKGLKQLTYDQLTHGDNYNNVQDKDKLDKDVRDRILKDRANKDVSSDLPPGTTGDLYNDGFSFDKANSIRVDNTFATGASGITYRNNRLTIDSANSIVINAQNFLTDIFNFVQTPAQFFVKNAQSLRIGTPEGFIAITDVVDTAFSINN